MIQSQVLGQSGVSVASLAGTVAIALTAAGAAQTDALALPAAVNMIGTAAAGTGVILPAGTAGDSIDVYNGGANSATVYPPVGGTINNLAANTGLAIATLKSGRFIYGGAITIFCELGA